MEFSDHFMAPGAFPADPELPTPEPKGFHWADYLVFVLFLVISLGIGMFQGLMDLLGCNKKEDQKEMTTEDFLMGNRNFSVVPVSLSTLAAFLSAILILGTPAEVYTQGCEYWIYMFGMMLSCVFATIFFVPLLYPLRLTSSYEYLELRFKSKAAKLTGSVILIVMQLLYMGVCLYSPATALEAVTGFPEWASIVIGGVIALVYVALGGMKASVWTSAFQAFVMAAGVIMVIIKGSIDLDGFGNIWDINAKYDGRVEFFNFDPNPLERHTFWTLVVGGTIGWLSTYGVNQASVQRFSSVPTLNKGRAVVLLNIPGLAGMVSICVMSGMTVFAWYDYVGCDPLKAGYVSNSNQLLPYYVMDRLDIPGIPGIFLACLFAGALSTMSSSLGACAAVTWEDALKWKLGHLSNFTQVLINKILVVIYGFGGIGMAFMARNLGGTVLQASLSFTGAAGGPLLGLFLLGGIFPCANWIGAVTGGILGLAFPLWISFGAYDLVLAPQRNLTFTTSSCANLTFDMNVTDTILPTQGDITGLDRLYLVSYLWYPAIGASTVVVVGLLVSLLTGCSDPGEMEPKYQIPFFDRLFCCLPNESLHIMRCKIEKNNLDEEESAIQAYEDTMKGVDNDGCDAHGNVYTGLEKPPLEKPPSHNGYNGYTHAKEHQASTYANVVGGDEQYTSL